MTTTPTGVEDGEGRSEAEAVAALLDRWKDDEPKKKARPSDTPSEDLEDDAEDDTEETGDEEAVDEEEGEGPDADEEEGTEDPEETEPKLAEDDAVVVVSVGGKDHRVSVKDLRRLAGQEVALTLKSQELAERRKATDTQFSQYEAKLKALVTRAESKYEPFKKLDMLTLSRTMGTEDFARLRKSEQDAAAEVKYLREELDGVVAEGTKVNEAARAEAAKTCIKALTSDDSPYAIKGWSDEVYGNLVKFGVTKMGYDPAELLASTDPRTFKLLHVAMTAGAAQKAVKDKVKKVVKGSPSGNVKSSPTGVKVDAKIALDRARKTGREDDAMKALMARWS